MEIAKAVYLDPFHPVLKTVNPLAINAEQKLLIKEVLSIVSSDSQFAEKAYDAITLILTNKPVVPVVTSLEPSEATIGDPSFLLHVYGTDFDLSSKISFAGHDEPTTLITDNEVTTGVDMSVWKGADVLPVLVKNNGVASNSVNFTFHAAPVQKLAPPKPPETKATVPVGTIKK